MEPDDVIGKYHIRKLIGRGGMGVVYLAEDTTLMRLVALKVLDRTMTAAPQFEQRFLQEARIVAGLKHPNIVPIHALTRIGEDWIIEMPFIEGGSLMEAGEKGVLSVRQTLKCIRDILLALAACHESGLIHRDVKPGNILLGEQQQGLLSDFGLAKLLTLHQADSMRINCSSSLFIGTPRYAPPESWEEQEPTPRWDIYSSGMVMYEAIAGATPFSAQTPLSLMKQMIEKPIPPLKEVVPTISDALSDLTSDMLAMNPEERPQDMADVLERFWALPELSDPGDSPPVLVKRRPRRPASFRFPRTDAASAFQRLKKRRLWAAGIFAAILVAAGGFYGIYALYARGPAISPWVISETLSLKTGNDLYSSHILLDGIDMDTQEIMAGPCAATSNDDGSRWSMLLSGAMHIWFIEMQTGPHNRVEITGQWIDYNRPSALLFRQGTLSGKGRWIIAGEELSLSLLFEKANSMATWERSLLLKRSQVPPASSELPCAFASTDGISALIYNEAPSRKLPWITTLETFLQDWGLARLAASRLAPPSEAIRMDGRLDEAVWRVSLETDSSIALQAPPASGPDTSFLRACYDDDALYLGVHVSSFPGHPRLLLALQTEHAIPAHHALRRMLQMEHDSIVAAHSTQAGISTPGECDWEIQQYAEDGMLELEIKIPFASLEKNSPPPPTERWLLNMQVERAQSKEEPAVARWGHETLDDTPCGLVLSFEP